jgi:hypothetical protein
MRYVEKSSPRGYAGTSSSAVDVRAPLGSGRSLLLFAITVAGDLFDEDGLRDDETLTRLEKFVTGFVEFVADEKGRASR